MKNERLKRIIDNMEKHKINQMVVTSPASIFYLTGKWIEPGERLLALYINTNGKLKFLVNELFPINEDLGLDMEIYNDSEDPIAILSNVAHKGSMGIDKAWPSHFLIRLMNRKQDVIFVNGSPIIDEVRMIKDEEEIELMRQSSIINDRVMGDLVNIISKNYEEKKVCKILDELYEKHTAEGFSFYPLVAYGGNAAEPHHDSDNSKLKEGDSVILDIGGRKNFYCSDMTRTVFYKEPKEEFKTVYNTVLEANLKAIEAVKPGIRFCDIDKAARDVIDKAGYGKYFTHRTGHNIGTEVHEFPDVSSVNEMVAQKGMIFSIEPGIYLSEKCGVRIEDLVVVTENGCEVLNKYTKELQIKI